MQPVGNVVHEAYVRKFGEAVTMLDRPDGIATIVSYGDGNAVLGFTKQGKAFRPADHWLVRARRVRVANNQGGNT